MEEKINRFKTEPEKFADEVADKVVEMLGKAPGVGRIRRSHILSAFIGGTGVALVIIGIEKVFADLPGTTSVALGLLFMALSGALLGKLSQ